MGRLRRGRDRGAARGGARDRRVRGAIESDLPLGGGLSSSASLEVALLRALRHGCSPWRSTTSRWRASRSAPRPGWSVRRSGSWIRWRRASPIRDAALFLDTRSLAYERRPAAARCRADRDPLRSHAPARRRRLPCCGAPNARRRRACSAFASCATRRRADLAAARAAVPARPARAPRGHRERTRAARRATRCTAGDAGGSVR